MRRKESLYISHFYWPLMLSTTKVRKIMLCRVIFWTSKKDFFLLSGNELALCATWFELKPTRNYFSQIFIENPLAFVSTMFLLIPISFAVLFCKHMLDTLPCFLRLITHLFSQKIYKNMKLKAIIWTQKIWWRHLYAYCMFISIWGFIWTLFMFI